MLDIHRCVETNERGAKGQKKPETIKYVPKVSPKRHTKLNLGNDMLDDSTVKTSISS
jgi:hypothetical protein